MKTIYWSIGNAFITYRLDRAQAVSDSLHAARADSAASAAAAYHPAEQRFTITAPRDIPEGTVVLRGARAITMKGYEIDRKSTRLNSSHGYISYAVFCL